MSDFTMVPLLLGGVQPPGGRSVVPVRRDGARAALRGGARRDESRLDALGGARSPLGLSLHRQIKVEGSVTIPSSTARSFVAAFSRCPTTGATRRWTRSRRSISPASASSGWGGRARRPLAGVIAAFGPASGSVDVRCFPERGALAVPETARGWRRSSCRWCAAGACRTTGCGSRWSMATRPTLLGDRRDRRSVAPSDSHRWPTGPAAIWPRGWCSGARSRNTVVESVAGGGHAGMGAGRVRVSAPVCLRVHWSALGARPAAPRPRRESDGRARIAGWTHR